VPGRQSDDDGGRVGQSDLPDNGRPARGRRSLQPKEEKDSTKEAFDGAAFAQFLRCPGGRQARAVLLSLRIPGNDSDGSQRGVNPVDEMQTPIGGIQADDAWANGIEADSQFQQGTGKRSIMSVSRREQEMHG